MQAAIQPMGVTDNKPASTLLSGRAGWGYGLSLLIPAYTLLVLSSGPHSAAGAFLTVLPLWSLVLIDAISPRETRQPPPVLAGRPFNWLLYTLALSQLINIALLLLMAARLSWVGPLEALTALANLYAVKVIVGTSSTFSGIMVAHELIHRRRRYAVWLGRLLLSLVCYPHFAIEHLHGHHRRVGQAEDPASARFGESYEAFWARTVPAQFHNAWQLENRRLGWRPTRWQFPKPWRHQVLQGLVLQLALLLAIAAGFGITALLAFGIQAYAAVRKLEAVNYLEHWGLSRRGPGIDASLSWDTDSWFTLHTTVGLSRHADHHGHTQTPFQNLRYRPDSPKLPYGYFVMTFLAVMMNRTFQRLLTRQLRTLQLGPFQSRQQRAA